MTTQRTSRGDAFLTKFATMELPDLIADSDVQEMIKRYRAKYPVRSDEMSDETIVRRYALFLAKCPRKSSGGPS